MNIEELRQIKNKTISQQNQLMYLEMKACADSASGYLWLEELLSRYNLGLTDGILILLSDIPDKAGTLWYGTWLTRERQFFEFVVATTKDGKQILAVESWVQPTPEVSANKQGVGKTPAFIALELLSKISS